MQRSLNMDPLIFKGVLIKNFNGMVDEKSYLVIGIF